MSRAPIVLFVYNRIEHTIKTIEALKKNILADESDLYIFSDGAKNEESFESVNALREYLKGVSGFKSIHIVKREYNFGLADNIISGVTEIINKYKKAIVLEDDIVTSKYFLKYMNHALDKYENIPEVMSISGFISPIDTFDLPDAFFLPWFECWGWATWKRSWDYFERNPQKVIQNTNLSQIKYINVYGSDPGLWNQVIDNYRNKIKTWAIFYHVIICENRGLVLYPRESLCRNIGFDGSGENCTNTNSYDVDLFEIDEITFPDKVLVNDEAVKSFKNFNLNRVKRIFRIKLNLKKFIFYLIMK